MNEIDKTLTKLIEKNKTPSVQYVIFDTNDIIHKFQGGFADIKNKKETTKKTTYNAFSVTKTFTALAILQLAEQGMIDIEQPAIKYLPDFPYPPEITIRQLLNHSSGIPNPIPLSWIHLADEHASFDRNAFFNQVYTKNNTTKARPNEKYAYSNLGYVLLGQLIEKATGISYEEFIRTNILNPLKIDMTDMDFTLTNNHAKGYHKKYSLSNAILGFMIDKSIFVDTVEGKWNSFKDNYVNGASYGGLIGTSDAFVKYVQELLKPNGKLITNTYKKKLFLENLTNNGKATGMCLSWFSGQLDGNQYFAHAGGGGGYYCEIRIYPDIGIGSVIMFNRTGMKDERFLDKLDKYVTNK
ncbi:MAG: serine hydrolase domain-containing protein [Maribacter sp.]|uniref:serine hydrolase domain-containing protein n=1 Tax=Maribacter sp. TaxID=1897614 RepID=UPI003C771C34